MSFIIPLTRGCFAIVDDVDADLAALKWHAAETGSKTPYAKRNVPKESGKQTTQLLHQVIAARMGILGEVDHQDRDGLNCTRKNLRAATTSQNVANQGLRIDNTSGVKGVSWHKVRRKWQANVRIDGKLRYLGIFDDLAAAESVVKAEREKIFGEFSCHE